ncbi:MAG: hypothetical protein K2O73_04945, partial [Lachnospiraceae bacterium]|nr:hypothetical protein [Lachnospiraceae bacterium]
TYAVQKDGITFTVTYPSNIKCGETTTFRFAARNADGTLVDNAQYRIHTLMVYDGTEYVNVYDVSWGTNSAYATKDTFDFTFYASGTYYIRFNVLYKNASGTFAYMDTGAYDNGIVLNVNDSAYPSVEEITDKVVGECLAECSGDFEKAVWLNDWLIEHCSYDYTYTYCSAEGALARGSGTCEAYHRAYVMLLNKAGIATGRITGNGHVWTAVKLDGKWYQVDPTWNDAGYTDPNLDLRHLYFGLNDDIMSMVHSEHTPVRGYESDSLDNNYLIRSGEIMKWVTPQMEAVRKHIAARETEFTLEIKNTNYAEVLYSLVAHVLTNTSWSEEGLKVDLQAEYSPKDNADGTIDTRNGTISCTVKYSEIPSQGQQPGTGTETVTSPYDPVFDAEYYAGRYSDLYAAYGNDREALLNHFLTFGMREGRQGCAGFDVHSYYNAYPDLRRAFGNDLKSYYIHYLEHGKEEGRTATGCSTMRGAVTVYNGIDYAPVYDYNYYVNKYVDIRQVFGADDSAVLQHFVMHGMREGRQGCAGFDVHSYYNAYPDLRRAFGNDLKSYYMHYLEHGRWEGRAATGCSTLRGAVTVYNGIDYAPVYDYNYYVNKYVDIRQVFGADDSAVLQHFVTHGMREGRQAKNSFDIYKYRSRYQDLNQAFGDDLISYYVHYLQFGIHEGRIAD